MNVQQSVTMWEKLDKSRALYAVASVEDYRFYTETVEEQGLTDEEPQEALLRVFLSLEEAERYREALVEYQGDNLAAVGVPFDSLFDVLESVDENSRTVHGYPVRYELCVMPEGEWPKTVTVLWSSLEVRH